MNVWQTFVFEFVLNAFQLQIPSISVCFNVFPCVFVCCYVFACVYNVCLQHV